MIRKPFSLSVYMTDKERERLNGFFARYSSLRRSDVVRNYLIGMINLFDSGRPCFMTRDGELLGMDDFASYVFFKEALG